MNDQDVIEAIDRFLAFNFPQIAMHGGESYVEAVDLDAGHAVLALDGACDGCGLSPMTTAAIQQRLPAEIPEIATIEVRVGTDQTAQAGAGDVPF
ncbi:NifU family protein [Halorubellus litoreus]|uniref:NifU family protein n=1 Tax=Halorubellus litoreus TaxID=755308 RepID=A0ABD5VFY3_9EURY